MSNPPSGTQGIGKSKWGGANWGSGFTPPPGPPVITPLAPLADEADVAPNAPIFIRLTDDNLVNQATLSIAVGAVIYVLGGVAQHGAQLFVTANAGHGFDLELRVPVAFALGLGQAVVVRVADDDGEWTDLSYGFNVGTGLRLMRIANPAPQVLTCYYNRPLRQDAGLTFVPNWIILPISAGAAPLEITEVVVDKGMANVVMLRYAGGGSSYQLTNSQVVDDTGNFVDDRYNSALFEIFFAGDPPATIKLFDTIYGPIGISLQNRSRRTMDNHVIGRSIALGMDEQFRLRMANLDDSSSRTGKPGKNRT